MGVGFSYADYGETVETTEDAARNVYAFVWVQLLRVTLSSWCQYYSSIFFDTFKQFQGRRFHLAGESYGVGALAPEGVH